MILTTIFRSEEIGMNKEKGSASGGVGFLGLLAVLFIGLKLCGVVSWSWWWVLAPLWIPLLIPLGMLLGFLLLFFIADK